MRRAVFSWRRRGIEAASPEILAKTPACGLLQLLMVAIAGAAWAALSFGLEFDLQSPCIARTGKPTQQGLL